jgi:hypothetical protein
MSESSPTPTPASEPPPGQPAAEKPAAGGRSVRTGIVAVAGVLVTLAVAGLVLMKSGISLPTGGDPAQPTLSFVAKSDLGPAAATLTPSAAGALVADAQQCKIPLVSMTISKGTAPIGSTIRIRSGSYVSPYFTITEEMQRIAVPYPAPYGAGAGTMVVEGNAGGAIVGFTPTKIMTDLPGIQSVPVVWRPVNPC